MSGFSCTINFMDGISLRRSLADLPIPDLRFFESIGSTNDEAMAWADGGALDWALVVADQQTQGRGRMGRHWVTNPGAALAFSLVLRLSREETAFAGLFSPLGAMGVASALEEIGLAAMVKWPNDVLLNRRKVCGILGEAAWTGDRLHGMVLGIGVNVASESVPPADELLFPATCVEAELGRRVDRQDLLKRILVHLLRWRMQLGQAGFLEAWQERMAFRGEQVVVKPPLGDPVTGRVVGLDQQGNLILALPGGGDASISAGDVHLRLIE
jgi:BirA family biotin operon repressor/biotin-[acetyl-CoA-carboxylase] ligase